MKNRFAFNQNELSSYRENGFLVRTAVFSKEEVSAIQQAVEQAATYAHALSDQGHTYILDGKRFVDSKHITVQYEPGLNNQTIKVIEPVHELDPYLDNLISDPRITHGMQSILNTEHIALWTDKLNLKRAQAGSGFGWHQDSPYWIHDCQHVDKLPNVLLSIDAATNDNGCFQVIRGSHKEGCLPGKNDGSQLGGFYTNPDCFDPSMAVLMEVPAGSLVFFDAHTVHGSFENKSKLTRRAMVLTYQPAGFPTLKSGEFRDIKISA